MESGFLHGRASTFGRKRAVAATEQSTRLGLAFDGNRDFLEAVRSPRWAPLSPVMRFFTFLILAVGCTVFEAPLSEWGTLRRSCCLHWGQLGNTPGYGTIQ